MGYDLVSLLPAFCAGFLGRAAFEQGELALADRLERAMLDYSVASLHAVDRYLAIVHEDADSIDEQTYTNTIIATGCYVGEVIRRNDDVEWTWVNYDDACQDRPDLTTLIPYAMGTAAVLISDQGTLTMPINKVGRFVEEGPENSTHFYVQAEISGDPRR